MDAIVRSARARLRSDDELTMRAVASDVGLTGPGLYRYVTSMAELRLLLIHEGIGSARAQLDKVGQEYDNPIDKLVASAVALRMWALTYPAEFRLAFASPDLANSYSSTEVEDLAQRLGVDRINTPGVVGEYFGPIFNARLIELGGEYQVPAEIVSIFEPHAEKCISKLSTGAPVQYGYLTGVHGPASRWAFLYLWSRLYGVIAFEVFNHLEADTVTSALLLRTTLFEMARQVGTELDIDRTNAIIDAEIAREVPGQ